MPLKKLKSIGKKILGGAGKAVKKIVPKEVAGIMQVAAPFVAASNPMAALALTTAGQYRSRGRINPLQTILSLAPSPQVRGFTKGDVGLFGLDSLKLTGRAADLGSGLDKFLYGAKATGPYTSMAGGELRMLPGTDATQGIFGIGGEFGPKKFLEGKLLSPTLDAAGKPVLSKSRLAALAASGLSLAAATKEIEQEAVETGASESDIDALKAEAAEFWSTLSSDDFKVTPTLAQGGRVGFQDGTDVSPTTRLEKMANYKALSEPLDYGRQFPPFLKKIPIKYEQSRDDFETMQKERFMYDYDKPKMSEKMLNKIRDLLDKDDREASADPMTILNQMAIDMFNKPLSELTDREREMIMSFMKPNAKKGGLMRQNLALGTRPTAQESGLGGLPIEADMRYSGGFMPYGAREKADDVPARLSKNEFVFTADAVRAAGGGSVQKGAQKMYNTMKQLEAMGKA
jgi:hypothetical protein